MLWPKVWPSFLFILSVLCVPVVCVCSSGVGLWVGEECRILGTYLPMGTWPKPHVDTNRPKPGSTLGQVRLNNSKCFMWHKNNSHLCSNIGIISSFFALGTGPQPTMSRPGMMKWGITAIPTLRSVTHTVHSDVQGLFVLTTLRYGLSWYLTNKAKNFWRLLYKIFIYLLKSSLCEDHSWVHCLNVFCFCFSWCGRQVTVLAVLSMCVTTWMCGEWSGPKLSIWSATTPHRKFSKWVNKEEKEFTQVIIACCFTYFLVYVFFQR